MPKHKKQKTDHVEGAETKSEQSTSSGSVGSTEVSPQLKPSISVEEQKIDPARDAKVEIAEAASQASTTSDSAHSSPESTPKLSEEENLELVKQLINAIKKNNLEKVKHILTENNDINLNIDDNIELNPLIMATWSERTDIIKTLVNYKGINLDLRVEGITALERAVATSKKEIVSVLLIANAQIDDEHNVIYCAARNNDLEMFKLLLSNLSDPDQFLKDHGVHILSNAGILTSQEGRVGVDFVEWITYKLISICGTEKALEHCAQSIPAFAGLDESYEEIIVDIFLPIFLHEKMPNKNIINIFEENSECFGYTKDSLLSYVEYYIANEAFEKINDSEFIDDNQ